VFDQIRARVNLSQFKNESFSRGRPVWIEIVWLIVQALFVNSWLPGSKHRVLLLRIFGAQIGKGAVIKPHLKVKFPWRLRLGDYVWLGEGVWIDNLATVDIGNNVCVSQGAYLCTGSHDWKSQRFDLITREIFIRNYAWVCAKTILAPGTKVGEGTVVSIGAVASGDLLPWKVYAGSPALAIKDRMIV
jgi:putative colanic acid biosynthesis acetyltransferase WcaF